MRYFEHVLYLLLKVGWACHKPEKWKLIQEAKKLICFRSDTGILPIWLVDSNCLCHVTFVRSQRRKEKNDFPDNFQKRSHRHWRYASITAYPALWSACYPTEFCVLLKASAVNIPLPARQSTILFRTASIRRAIIQYSTARWTTRKRRLQKRF